MTPQAALIELLERVGAMSGAAVLVSDYELSQWPNEAVAAMKSQKLIAKARPGSSAICPGCERECVMPVQTLPTAQRGSESFIVCDKRSDINRVPVPVSRLEQWQTTSDMIADVLAKLLGLSRTASKQGDGKRWDIGVLKGKKHKSLVTLLADDNLNLSLAGHTVPLIEVLAIEKNILTVDKGELIRLVDRPAAHNEAPDAEEIEESDFGNDEVEMSATTTFKPSASASEIRRQFTVIKSEDANDKWWKKMMRNASDNRLKECRVGGGRKGAVGSLWRPDLVAGWLVDRRAKGRDGMSKEQARASLKKFPGCSEIAQEFFPTDE